MVLFILALRHLGTARTGAYFATAPFVGALVAIPLFSEPLTLHLAAAGGLMALGVWLHHSSGTSTNMSTGRLSMSTVTSMTSITSTHMDPTILPVNHTATGTDMGHWCIGISIFPTCITGTRTIIQTRRKHRDRMGGVHLGARGAQVNFAWTVSGGVVNFDLHGDGGGNSTSYEKGCGVPGAEGVLEAAFDGNHGWFWRNRGDADVTITLRTDGNYSEIKRVL